MTKVVNIKARIASIKESITIKHVLIKNYEECQNVQIYEKRMKIQLKVIAEAEKTIAIIRHERKIAPAKIAKLKKSIARDEKRLVVFYNQRKIEQLQKVILELRVLQQGDE